MTAFADTQTWVAALQAGALRAPSSEYDIHKRVAHDIFFPSAAGRGTLKGIILPAGKIRIYRNESRLYTWAAWTTSGVTLTVGYAAYTCPVVEGSVTTAATAVTWVSGDKFSLSWAGTIIINGVSYTVSSVTDPTHLTLTATAGTQATAVLYNRNGLAEVANTAFFHDSVSPQAAVIDEVQDGYGSPGTQPYVDFYTAGPGLQVTYTIGTQDMAVADVLDVYMTYSGAF